MASHSNGVTSPWLGDLHWDPGCELDFPAGLPGFERYKRLVPVEIPSQRPLVYLQSVDNPEVCFLALPALTVDPRFGLYLSDEDRSLLDFDASAALHGGQPALGADVLCLALLMPSGTTVKTNLDAPVVINLHNRRGVQAIAASPLSGAWCLNPQGGWEALC